MQLTQVLLTLSAFAALGQAAFLDARANNKANEYPKTECKDSKGGNTPSFAHKPNGAGNGQCISMDDSTASVYIAVTGGQKVTAYKNQKCDGGNGETLGNPGRECVELNTYFPAGRIKSLRYEIPKP
ncbi:MAG: hypothetical protein M1814_000697 [Vezdaea aestivalis]|nr:MAG: hypothetical protein M1814_000697 [Vezdaea aestivalis]